MEGTPPQLGYVRSKRFAAVFDDGKCTNLFVSAAPGDPTGDDDPSASLAENVLKSDSESLSERASRAGLCLTFRSTCVAIMTPRFFNFERGRNHRHAQPLCRARTVRSGFRKTSTPIVLASRLVWSGRSRGGAFGWRRAVGRVGAQCALEGRSPGDDLYYEEEVKTTTTTRAKMR